MIADFAETVFCTPRIPLLIYFHWCMEVQRWRLAAKDN